jgi:hypothetical protein
MLPMTLDRALTNLKNDDSSIVILTQGESETETTEPMCWMAAILFSPLPQLARRLGFVVLGVLLLIGLSEISKLDLHQYLRPPKASENSSPAHNLPSHAAA